MSLRITVAINKQNCALVYNHCFPDVIDRNIFNIITLRVHCYAGLKQRNIVLYCIVHMLLNGLAFWHIRSNE